MSAQKLKVSLLGIYRNIGTVLRKGTRGQWSDNSKGKLQMSISPPPSPPSYDYGGHVLQEYTPRLYSQCPISDAAGTCTTSGTVRVSGQEASAQRAVSSELLPYLCYVLLLPWGG